MVLLCQCARGSKLSYTYMYAIIIFFKIWFILKLLYLRYFRHSSYGSIANLSCHICKFKLKHFCLPFWIIRWHISATACNINYGNLLFIYIDIRLIYVSITCNFHIDIILYGILNRIYEKIDEKGKQIPKSKAHTLNIFSQMHNQSTFVWLKFASIHSIYGNSSFK